jgi:photosystem II stability/assembly factor-like uncharacterized protein
MRKKLFVLTIVASCIASLSAFGQSVDMEKLSDLSPRSIGPAGMSGRVTDIDVVLREPTIMYVATASGGLWKSESGGVEWNPVFDDERVINLGSVAIDQSNPDIVWVGTGEGNPRNSISSGYGLYKTIDGGKNWKLMGLENTRQIHRIIVDPTNSDVVYVGATGSPWGPHPERGVYKTTDGGKSWKKILYVNETTGVGEMVMDPFNPNKIFVNMWDHQRWPWFFRSGGPGSGLYVTHDGGENWKELTGEDGLPEGELGRMGIAIARNNTDIVYAIIESKANALYRSDDGGFTWRKMSDQNIGNRPFYYYEIYVDPANENRIYSLYSRVSISEDGGRTFSTLRGFNIHPDHHAWWIHPENPKFMINGNDGGMAITYDLGETWRFIENLPVGQFYHIRVDNELPYHVYGGLQDNGSWRGPAYLWSRGGIINTYWESLMGGDGFDVLPDPGNPRYCYAMSQQGYVGRVDLETGYSRSIRPVHPEGEELRFHWNAAIEADPFDPNTIYFGSQFVHKSTNRGDSWEIISPDLTTNDPEKQKQLESGGLTLDVTGAENHTTILVIAPSPLKQGMIWVGTDDGQLQLTQDGGENWTNLSANMTKLVPENSWIPQVHPSRTNEGEAFVVVNNYRRNDFKPYLLHTTNYGKTWTNMVSENSIFGYVLSFIQDPLEPNLMFLGSEYGLYFSIDAGETWNLWSNGFPRASTMDLAIQEREHDLVIGTFGRSVYILDDIRPLREMATTGGKSLEEAVHIYDPPDAYIVSQKSSPGYYSTGNAYYSGENRRSDAMITFSVKEGTDNGNGGRSGFGGWAGMAGGGGSPQEGNGPGGKRARIEIIDEDGTTIRTLTFTPKTGMNRVYWGLDKKGYRYPSVRGSRYGGFGGRGEQGGGGYAIPGRYKLKISYNGSSDSTFLNVRTDPRMDISAEDMRKNQEYVEGMMKKVELLADAFERITESKETIESVKKLTPRGRSEKAQTLRDATKKVEEAMKEMTKNMIQEESGQGISRNPDMITYKLWGLRSALMAIEPLNDTEKLTIKQTEEALDAELAKVDAFFAEDWMEFRKVVEESDLSLFKDYDPLQ